MIFKPFKRGVLLGTLAGLSCAPAIYAQAQTAEEPQVDIEAPEDEEAVLQTVIVRGEFIPEPQRETSQVATFLLPEDLERQGDSNAALALTRLSGLSISGGRFVIVRGLNDRYSSALLNGSPLPSPEPLRRTVPLDLFPSEVLDSIAVQKTYSANYPGEFGGGVVDLKTAKRPIENFLTFKVGGTFNTETTNEEGIFVGGSDTDFFGFDDGLRDIPDPLAAVLNSDQSLNALPNDQVEIIGESLVNSPLRVIQQEELDPGFDVSISGGYVFDRGNYDIGLVGVAGFESGWETQLIKKQDISGLAIIRDFDVLDTTYNATVNALGSATLDYGSDHEVQATVFYVHDTDKEARITTGTDFDSQGERESFNEENGWFERELILGQLRGEHLFGNFTLGWRGSLSQATRDAPYDFLLQRQINDDGVPALLVANRNSLSFSELTDDLASVGGNISYDFNLSPTREATVTAGFDVSELEREYIIDVFRFSGGNALSPSDEILRPDFLFSPDNIDPARFFLTEVSSFQGGNNYDAQLDILAGFVMADFDITDFLQATVGLRYEDAEQSVDTFDRFGGPRGLSTDLENDYYLPSAMLTWNFADDLQLRVGYSETITRPQFRELASSAFRDPESNRTFQGFFGLVDTELTNYDARLEYYFGRNQFVTLAGFYKDIKNPIEEISFERGTGRFDSTFFNAPEAELFGAEFEYRTRFEFPGNIGFLNDREGLFSINYTFTASEVTAEEGTLIADPGSVNTLEFRDASFFDIDGSDLQGTSENILNAQLGWESELEQLTLLVGWVDERIIRRGVAGQSVPDVIEDPGVQVDLVYKRDIELSGNNFTFSLSGRNLLNEAHEEFQLNEDEELGRTEFNTYDRGISVSAGLAVKF